jgi:hypothetical protein
MKEALAKDCLTILNRYKSFVGLADYSVRLHPTIKKADGALAEVESDRFEKELTVQLCNGFLKLDNAARKKVLIHELVHARIEVYTEKVAKLVEDEEEMLANDLTTAITMSEEQK